LSLPKWLRVVALVFVAWAGMARPDGHAAQAPRLSDQDIIDAHHYFLGRLLILRQEHLDFKAGFIWNRMLHRDPGAVVSAVPSLDVVYSEAWVAVDETSCTMVEVPAIRKRYYTVQVLNGWGETVANINERAFPGHASGKFGLCLKGARAGLPAGTLRVELPGRKSRLVARVELGADPQEAVKLQRQIRVYPLGKPKIEPPVEITLFENQQLPRVEAFNKVDAILAAERDINPGMEALQSKARAIAKAARDVEELKRIDEAIVKQAIPQFQKAARALGAVRNGWSRSAPVGNYGSNYRARAVANYAALWSNNAREVAEYWTYTDAKGRELDGSNTYAMTFPKGQPHGLVRYFWSILALDSAKFQVMDNPQKVYALSSHAKLYTAKGGALALYFGPRLPDGVPPQNWLPTAAGQKYNLTFRFYGPRDSVASGGYFPPPLVHKK
jgi:hypothetical protein